MAANHAPLWRITLLLPGVIPLNPATGRQRPWHPLDVRPIRFERNGFLEGRTWV